MTTEQPSAIPATTPYPKPRKLNQAMITALSEAVKRGNYPSVACQLVHIDWNTFSHWSELGNLHLKENIDSEYSALLIAIKEAEAIAEEEMIAVVREAATVKREWLPAITFLERRHRERWGRPAPMPPAAPDTQSIRINVIVKHSGPELSAERGQIIEGVVRELPEASKKEEVVD